MLTVCNNDTWHFTIIIYIELCLIKHVTIKMLLMRTIITGYNIEAKFPSFSLCHRGMKWDLQLGSVITAKNC